MKFFRRIVGILVMFAGFLGLLLSLAGLAGVWMGKPTAEKYVTETISTLKSSIDISQKVIDVTADALGSTVESVDALSTMLTLTAVTVDQTLPVFDQINSIMSDTVPSSLASAVTSLQAAQQAAAVLDSSIKSLENFQVILSNTPYIGAYVEPIALYSPEVPMAVSLGELAANLEKLSTNFTSISTSMENAGTNLVLVKDNLTTMSASVGLISLSLQEYQGMVRQSKESLDNLAELLGDIQNSMPKVLSGLAVVLTLFFLWLFAAQVVIISQGWELYHGTAGRMGT